MDSASYKRGIITLAYGHKRFVEQARSLAHSLELHAPRVPRSLITDSTDPEILKHFTEIIPFRPEYGSGVRQKLFLDLYSPYEQTLFIDSDCLVLGNLESFWSAFESQYFGVPGYRYLQKGSMDLSLNVDFVLEKLNITAIPKFNGGLYYFRRSSEAAKFFTTARETLEKWRDLRLYEFRGDGPNDESVYSVAMAIHHIGPTSMGPGGMWTPLGYKGPLHLDAVKGTCSFEKEGMKLSPEIVHFPGGYIHSFAYARERAKLKLRIESQTPNLSELVVPFTVSFLWHCFRLMRVSKLVKRSMRACRQLGSNREAQVH